MSEGSKFTIQYRFWILGIIPMWRNIKGAKYNNRKMCTKVCQSMSDTFKDTEYRVYEVQP